MNNEMLIFKLIMNIWIYWGTKSFLTINVFFSKELGTLSTALFCDLQLIETRDL